MNLVTTRIAALLLLSLTIISCRGQKSEKPPISPQQNMQFQERFNAQEENQFFADNRSMRMPVEGTISRGNLRADKALYEGTAEDGSYVEDNPLDVTTSFLYRGKDRYDIYCAMCHGGTGDGRGIIMTGEYGYVPAPTFHSDRSRNYPDGEIYSAIANGIRNMPSYASQIPVEDRWAIVAYVRALQESHNISEDEMEQYQVDLAQLRDQYVEEQERAEALAAARAVGADETVSVERGEALYTRYACNTCHSVDGRSLVGPTFAGLYQSERNFEDGTSGIADEEYLIESIIYPGEKVVEGYQNIMQPYDYLSESEIQSLVEFIKAQSDN